MGEKTTITLLTSINGYLKQIIDTNVNRSRSQTRDADNKKMTSVLNKGGVLSGETVQPKKEKSKFGDLFLPAESIAALNDIPLVIKKAAGIKDKDLNTMLNAVNKIVFTLKDINNSEFDANKIKATTKGIEAVTSSIKTMSETKFTKLALNLKTADALGLNKLLCKTVDSFVKATQTAGKISTKNLNALKSASKSTSVLNSLAVGLGVAMGSIIAVTITINKIGAKEFLKGAAITLGVLAGYSAIALGIIALSGVVRGSRLSMKLINNFAITLGSLLIGTALLGATADKLAPVTLKGLKLLGLVVLEYAVLGGVMIAISALMKTSVVSSSFILAVAAVSMVLVTETVVLSLLLQGSWDTILKGFGGMSALLIGYGVMAGLIAVTSKMAVKSYKPAVELATFVLLSAAIVISSAYIGTLIQEEGGIKNILVGVTAVTVLSTALYGLTALLSKFGASPTITMGIKSLLSLAGLALVSEFVLSRTIRLSEKMKKTSIGDILLTFVGMTAIISGFGGLAVIVGSRTFRQRINSGIKTIALLEGLSYGAVIVLKGVLNLTEKQKKAGISYGDLLLTLSQIGLIIGGFGALAAIAGTYSAVIAAGALSILLVEGFVLGSIALIHTLIKFTSEIPQSAAAKIEFWNNIYYTINKITIAIGNFAAVAIAAGLAAPAIIAGSVSLLLVKTFAKNSIELITQLNELGKQDIDWQKLGLAVTEMNLVLFGNKIDLEKEGENGKGRVTFLMIAKRASLTAPFIIAGSAALMTLTGTISHIISTIQKLSELSKNASSIKIENISPVLESFESFVSKIETIGVNSPSKFRRMKRSVRHIRNMSTMIADIIMELANISGMVRKKNIEESEIRTMRIDDAGNVKYGEWFSTKTSIDGIKNTLKIFINDIDDTFADIETRSLRKNKRNIRILYRMMEPISKMAEVLSGYEGKDGMLRPIKYTDSGELIDTKFIDVKSVAESISGAVDQFVTTIFSNTNMANWEKMTGRKNKGAKRSLGIFATAIEPISNFTEALLKFSDGDEGTLSVPEYDEDGNIKSIRIVNVNNVAESIAGAVGIFIEKLIESSEKWKDLYKSSNTVKKSGFLGLKRETSNEIDNSIGIFSTVIEPISNFAEIMQSFDSENPDVLISYDSEGNKRTINVKNVALSIVSTLDSFIVSLYTVFDTNKDKFEFISEKQSSLVSTINNISGTLQEITKIDISKLKHFSSDFDKFINKISKLNDKLTSIKIDNIQKFLVEYTDVFNTVSAEFTDVEIDTTINKISGITNLLDSIIETCAMIDKKTFKTGNITKEIRKYKNTIDYIITELNDITIDNLSDPNVAILSYFTKIGETRETLQNTINSTLNDELYDSLVKYINKLQTVISSINKLDSELTIKHNTDDITSYINTIKFLSVELGKLNNLDLDIKGVNTNIDKLADVISKINQIGLDFQFSNVGADMLNVMNDMNTSINGISGQDGIEKLNTKMGDSFLRVKGIITEFDDVLDAGNQKRIKNITDIAAAIREVNNESSLAKDNLSTVRDILEAINNISSSAASGEIERAVNAINNISIRGGGNNNNSSGNSSNNNVPVTMGSIEDDVRNAIISTLDDAHIRTIHMVEEYITAKGERSYNISSDSAIEINN